jgi:imidazolonepropionase-like amidohydrolase
MAVRQGGDERSFTASFDQPSTAAGTVPAAPWSALGSGSPFRAWQPPGSNPPNNNDVIVALKRAGVKLLAGSDASLDPLDARTALSCELRTLVAAGLTPYEALAAATVNAGMFIRATPPKADGSFGMITTSAGADMLLLSADPRLGMTTLDRLLGRFCSGWHAR